MYASRGTLPRFGNDHILPDARVDPKRFPLESNSHAATVLLALIREHSTPTISLICSPSCARHANGRARRAGTSHRPERTIMDCNTEYPMKTKIAHVNDVEDFLLSVDDLC